MSKTISISVIIVFTAVAQVYSLECYDCRNCTRVTNEQLVTCGGTSTVAPSTTPGGQTTTAAPELTTTQAPEITSTVNPTTTPLPEQTTTQSQTTNVNPTGTVTTTLLPQQTTQISSEGRNSNHLSNRQARSVEVVERADDYVCLTVKYKEDSIDVTDRGCGLASEVALCETLMAGVNGTCTSCNTDRCNSAVSVQAPLLLLFAVVTMKFM